ncbi:conserved hypothetical protein [Ricinus communis]|uniref:Uncharacterized protein n=1 Tax=Ricinus communis TaxID=3988 RepID=B9TJH4_RICCO|nr:conserved hypothetical protein [Ricinus communis]
MRAPCAGRCRPVRRTGKDIGTASRAGVGVQAELRVRQLLEQAHRLLGREHGVVAALDHQHRLPDALQQRVAGIAPLAPGFDGQVLGGEHLRWRVRAGFVAEVQPLQESLAVLLAVGGGREEQVQQNIGRRLAADFADHLAEVARALAGRAAAGQHDAAHGLRLIGGDFLRQEAAQRKAEQVDRAGAERLDHTQRVLRHLRHIGWGDAMRGADAGVVEHDDLALPGQAVDDQRVPVVHGAGEVLHQEQRRLGAALAVQAIRGLDAIDRDVLGRHEGSLQGEMKKL